MTLTENVSHRKPAQTRRSRCCRQRSANWSRCVGPCRGSCMARRPQAHSWRPQGVSNRLRPASAIVLRVVHSGGFFVQSCKPTRLFVQSCEPTATVLGVSNCLRPGGAVALQVVQFGRLFIQCCKPTRLFIQSCKPTAAVLRGKQLPQT